MNNPSNYRGISLCDTSSTLYNEIINNRLREWVEQNNITTEYQAGFKRGYSATDNMFTLLACVQKQFAANQKLFVAFIDFEKAFDSINGSLLWIRIQMIYSYRPLPLMKGCRWMGYVVKEWYQRKAVQMY